MLALLADAAAGGEFERWVGPVLTSAMSVAASLFAWLSLRDKLKFDAEVVGLRRDVAALTEKTAECHEERDALQRRADLAAATAAAESRKVTDLERKMDELARRLDQKPPRRPPHDHNPPAGG